MSEPSISLPAKMRTETWIGYAESQGLSVSITDGILDALEAERSEERAAAQKLADALKDMLPYLYEEYRGLGYGNCAVCGTAMNGNGPNSRVGSTSSPDSPKGHLSDCPVRTWREALETWEART